MVDETAVSERSFESSGKIMMSSELRRLEKKRRD